jgi:hypothetical protein
MDSGTGRGNGGIAAFLRTVWPDHHAAMRVCPIRRDQRVSVWYVFETIFQPPASFTNVR